MKQTHKLPQIGVDAVQRALAASGSITAAAKALGVSRDSLHRWIKTEKIAKPGGTGPRARPAGAGRGRSPATAKGWSRSVRGVYDLSATELALVRLAEQALRLADDPTVKPELVLAASARFAALVRQLNLPVEENHGSLETATVAAFPRRA